MKSIWRFSRAKVWRCSPSSLSSFHQFSGERVTHCTGIFVPKKKVWLTVLKQIKYVSAVTPCQDRNPQTMLQDRQSSGRASYSTRTRLASPVYSRGFPLSDFSWIHVNCPQHWLCEKSEFATSSFCCLLQTGMLVCGTPAELMGCVCKWVLDVMLHSSTAHVHDLESTHTQIQTPYFRFHFSWIPVANARCSFLAMARNKLSVKGIPKRLWDWREVTRRSVLSPRLAREG